MEPDKKEPRYRGGNLSVDAAGDDLADFVDTRAGSRYVTNSLERCRRTCFTEARSYRNPGPTASGGGERRASGQCPTAGYPLRLSKVHNSPLPLKDPLRARFTRLSASQCERLACCGTLLVDVGFSNPGRWRNAAESLETSAVQMPPQLDQWLLPDEAILLAHSTLLVAWSVLHGARSEAGVLLGTPPETAGIVAGMTVNQLSYIAQRYAAWVRPRWMEAPKIWSGLLDFAADGSPDRSRFAVLRCWQLNGGHASWLESYFAARRWSCKR